MYRSKAQAIFLHGLGFPHLFIIANCRFPAGYQNTARFRDQSQF